MERKSKYFVLDVIGKQDSVSIDRLKVAYIDKDFMDMIPKLGPSNKVPKPPGVQKSPVKDKLNQRKTRSGRKVHWPKRLVEEM